MKVNNNKSIQTPELQHSFSPMHVWALALGYAVGWDSFINPGKKFLPNSGITGTAIGLILDELHGSLDILKFGFHYTIDGFDIYMDEMLQVYN